MNTDDLDSKKDAELDQIFALEVEQAREVEGDMMRLRDQVMQSQSFEHWVKIPNYATDANVIMPFLKKFGDMDMTYSRNTWGANFYAESLENVGAWDSSFPRCACMALIRAKRSKKGGGK